MAPCSSATLAVSESLVAQLRNGHDLAFDLETIEPDNPKSRRWMTMVRVQIPGRSLASTLDGHLLVIRLTPVPESTVPNLRWDPPDPRTAK